MLFIVDLYEIKKKIRTFCTSVKYAYLFVLAEDSLLQKGCSIRRTRKLSLELVRTSSKVRTRQQLTSFLEVKAHGEDALRINTCNAFTYLSQYFLAFFQPHI